MWFVCFGWFLYNGNASLYRQDFYDKTKLCHLRLGHVKEISLVELAKKGFPNSKKMNKLEFCNHFILEKK